MNTDDHSRIAVLFEMSPATDDAGPILFAVSVKWILECGPPVHIETGEFMKYHGTYVIQ
jgi:hypothetical protein